MSKSRLSATFAAAALVAGTALIAAPASAADGSISCSTTRWPLLKIDAKGPGNVRWVNLASSTQTSTDSFPGGYSERWGAYQKVSWVATNGGAGFYGAPQGSCY